MRADIRRIIAVEAHRRRTGRCPSMIHALGTGESFAIEVLADGFVDVETGLRACAGADGIRFPGVAAPVELRLAGDVGFFGFDPESGERFRGRAGGGSSVTVHEPGLDEYFQYAVVNDRGG